MRPLITSEVNAREYFRIRNISEQKPLLTHLFYKLTALNAMLYRKGVPTLELTLTIDEHKFAFSDKEVTPELVEIIESVCKAGTEEYMEKLNQITLVADYCIHDINDFYFNEASPYSSLDFFRDEEYFSRICDDVFYYTYIEDDNFDSAGSFIAYGTLNGRIYQGSINAEPLENMPQCVHWYAPYAAIIYEMEEEEKRTYSKDELHLIRDYFFKMNVFSNCSEVTTREGNLCFAVNHLVLQGNRKLNEFIQLTQLLCAHVAGCSIHIEFLELSVNVPLIFSLTINSEGVSFTEKRIEGLPPL